MADQQPAEASAPPAPGLPAETPSRAADAPPADGGSTWFSIRRPTPQWQAIVLGALCIVVCFALWWLVTAGDAESRIFTADKIPSPQETFGKLHSLWFDRELTRNTVVSLKRLVLGFGLALAIGVPLGILAGCFTRLAAFLSPLLIFGRNIPIAALIPLTMFIFGIGELRTVMFIFFACVAFVVADTARAIADVETRYIDTAYTLGAGRRHVILKVLTPLAMPAVFNSLRLLFGLAFGYIMLAELIKVGDETGGLGYLIQVSQRQGPREHIYLILLVIPLVALAIDRLLYRIQRSLFPYRYGGPGYLNQVLKWLIHRWDDLKTLVFSRSKQPVPQPEESPAQQPTKQVDNAATSTRPPA